MQRTKKKIGVINLAAANVTIPIPNEESIEAIQEVEKMKADPQAYKGYDDVDEMMIELLEWSIQSDLF